MARLTTAALINCGRAPITVSMVVRAMPRASDQSFPSGGAGLLGIAALISQSCMRLSVKSAARLMPMLASELSRQLSQAPELRSASPLALRKSCEDVAGHSARVAE